MHPDSWLPVFGVDSPVPPFCDLVVGVDSPVLDGICLVRNF